MNVFVKETSDGRFGVFNICDTQMMSQTYSRARDAKRGAARNGFIVN